MLGSDRRRRFYNYIALAFLLVALGLSFLGSGEMNALALEQHPRCTRQEHRHTSVCYTGEFLLCGQKAHTHGENCYPVLLKENDINQLLEWVDNTDDKSMEGIVTAMLDRFVPDHGGDPTMTMTAEEIRALNRDIASDAQTPDLQFNEQMLNASNLYLDQDVITVLTVGGTPSTATRTLNLYVQLDGRITFVESRKLSNYTPDYIYYYNLAPALQSHLRTNLTDGNIGTKYYFPYNITGTTGTPADFTETPVYKGNFFYIENLDIPRYALMSHDVDGKLVPVDFYTVKLDYSQVGEADKNQVEYVESGMSSTLAPDFANYSWYDQNGNPVTSMPAVITQTTILQARPTSLTVTFMSNGATVYRLFDLEPGTRITDPGIPSNGQNGTTFAGWFTDQACTNRYDFDAPVNSSLTLYAKWSVNTYPVTYTLIDENGNEVTTQQTVAHGDRVTLDEAYTWRDHYGNTYAPGQSVTITGNMRFTGTIRTHTVTFVDENGNSTSRVCGHGKNVTLPQLPAGYIWSSGTGNYAAGSAYGPVNGDITLTAVPRTLQVNYNVNFPSGHAGKVDAVPTIYGTNAYTASESVTGGQSVVTRNLTSRKARHEIGWSNEEARTYFFKGWTIDGTDLLIQPQATVNWNELEAYADANGNVNFIGVWENGVYYNSVTFFVRFDSRAVDTQGNITSQDVTNYTPAIHYTYLGGVDTSLTDAQMRNKYNIADTKEDNSFAADQAIRALYGERAEGIWMYDFPKDEDVFDWLKDYLQANPGKKLSVDGQVVDTNELDKEHYSIRWYVFKLEGQDTWHVDGKLVRREGNIRVSKAFGGVEEAIAQSKVGFHIVAENGTKDSSGNFTPYASGNSAFRQIVLVLDQATANALKSTYPNATFQVMDRTEGGRINWDIHRIALGEYWRVTEYPNTVDGYSYYAEYSIYDTDGEYTAVADNGTCASVVGKTFALDEDPNQGMLVDFSNFYYNEDHILLKKEDANTGRGIPGAVFQIWQNELLQKFEVEDGVYVHNTDGTVTDITTGSDGYAVISAFSYEHDSLDIREVKPPSGYDRAPDVEIGLDTDGATVVLKHVDNVPQEAWPDFAEMPSNDVAVIKDHVSEYMSVTVDKVWNTTFPADSVGVVLQANGNNAAALLPGLTNAQVKLSAANNWTYTWTDLPRYANGQEVQWSVKEVIVGKDATMADGVSFANWIVSYSPARKTDHDGDGDMDHWAYTVTNTSRRPMLILTKVSSGGKVLSGAAFSLEQVDPDANWQPVSGVPTDIQTTGANGTLTFDNLIAGAYYRLTETAPPAGHILSMEPVIISVDGNGQVYLAAKDGSLTVLDEEYIRATGLYNVLVTNVQMDPLPNTGGAGNSMYTQCGILLMLAAAALYIYIYKRGREEFGTP